MQNIEAVEECTYSASLEDQAYGALPIFIFMEQRFLDVIDVKTRRSVSSTATDFIKLTYKRFPTGYLTSCCVVLGLQDASP